jgi:hypothetical protein
MSAKEDGFYLGLTYPDWWADMVSSNRAVTTNIDGRTRGGPDCAFVVVGDKFERYSNGDFIPKSIHDETATATITALEAEVGRLREALLHLNRHLTIPAAEYVPAIPEAWKIIEAALKTKEQGE